MLVTIEGWEQEALEKVARLRNDPKEDSGIKRVGNITKQTNLDIHIQGVVAEYAVAKVLGVEMNLSFNLHGDNNTPDLYTEKNSISVKYRGKKGWDFALITDKMDDFDIAILCYPGITIHGWATRQQFKNHAIIKDYGYGKRLVLEAAHFNPLTYRNNNQIAQEQLKQWRENN